MTNWTRDETEEVLNMKPSTEDKVKGTLHKFKGIIKERVGKLTRNSDLEADGRAEKNTGKIQNWVGRVKKAVGR
jgi:uncharacterized protein YjbJ (UPF0337 family)